ncbi:hypothetical protein EV361DRAFT_512799 [Lentinula raphanica]|nr:hypothetical protein EV361DRAFT_512799 [Lentinula raphanica]
MSDLFIPPLGTPQQPSSQRNLPNSAAATAAPPSWAASPNMTNQYPLFNSPLVGTPFIPHGYTPAAATPATLPRGTPYGAPQHLSPVHHTTEYTGFPNFPPTPEYGPSPPLASAPQTSPAAQPPPSFGYGSPWAQTQTPAWHSAPAMGTPWGMNAMLPGGAPPMPPGMPPGMPPSGTPWGMQAMLPPTAYGPPQMPMQGMQGMGPPVMPPGGPPMMGMMGGGDPWNMAGMGQALPQPGGPLPRAVGVLGDRMDNIDEFTAGPNYGPVLEPFLVRVLNLKPRLNPLIQPPPVEMSDPEHDYLKWTMLMPSSMVQRASEQDPRVSWSTGRNDPATFPRITSLRLVPNLLPFTIEVFARDPNIGVTCGDVIDTIGDSMGKHSGQSEFSILSPDRQKMVSEAYRHNRSRALGVPGGRLGPGLRRMDFLGRETEFGGIKDDSATVRKVCGEDLPCTWVLCCRSRYPMTEREIEEQAIRDEAARAAEEERSRREEEARHRRREDETRSRRSRRSSRAPTVTTVTDEDDRSSTTGTVGS